MEKKNIRKYSVVALATVFLIAGIGYMADFNSSTGQGRLKLTVSPDSKKAINSAAFEREEPDFGNLWLPDREPKNFLVCQPDACGTEFPVNSANECGEIKSVWDQLPEVLQMPKDFADYVHHPVISFNQGLFLEELDQFLRQNSEDIQVEMLADGRVTLRYSLDGGANRALHNPGEFLVTLSNEEGAINLYFRRYVAVRMVDGTNFHGDIYFRFKSLDDRFEVTEGVQFVETNQRSVKPGEFKATHMFNDIIDVRYAADDGFRRGDFASCELDADFENNPYYEGFDHQYDLAEKASEIYDRYTQL